MIGKFVTAKLFGKDDCRQGCVKSLSPLIIQGISGIHYHCEGEPVIVVNPPTVDLNDKKIDELPPEIGIAWKEELKPLTLQADSIPMNVIDQIRLLYDQCDALLRRLEEHEKVMLELMKVR